MAITWVDRVPTYPNRMKITPENGGDAYYATVERADEPTVIGTPVNAANLNAMQEGGGSDGKQDLITVNGIVKGDGAGVMTAAVPGTDYTTPSTVQPITGGGTGANTAAAALANLGALPLAGGTLTGALILTSGVHYGDSLPSSGVEGQIFFLKV